jgi:predicted O-methyltransferase YrrM
MTRFLTCALVFCACAIGLGAQAAHNQRALDAQVVRFLERHREAWHEMNVPEADGRALHDLIVERRYRRVLEIGTSTGRSAIWMAWALSRTGGRLTTIEIDEARHRQALKNFEAAGLARFVTARLGDARRLVPRLAGPFDLVFIDADKDWYTNYAVAVLPKLSRGGALAAHGVSLARWPGSSFPVAVLGRDFYEYAAGLSGFETGFRAGVFVASRK